MTRKPTGLRTGTPTVQPTIYDESSFKSDEISLSSMSTFIILFLAGGCGSCLAVYLVRRIYRGESRDNQDNLQAWINLPINEVELVATNAQQV